MNDLEASRTALVTSLMRAVHTRGDPKPFLNDPWGDRFLPEFARDSLLQMLTIAAGSSIEDQQSAMDELMRANPAYGNVLLRSRYTENALEAALACGVGQYVLIGAGFDSYALRRSKAAQSLNVFEVDHPATQALKRQRLVDCGVADQEHLHFVAADLGVEDLESALARSAFDFDAPAFFSWLGVTMYLTREANTATLKSIAGVGASGSELVFSYIDQVVFDGNRNGEGARAFERLQRSVTDLGEPFLSGFDPQALAGELCGLGLQLEEDLSDRALMQRYDPEESNPLQVSRISRIARASIQ